MQSKTQNPKSKILLDAHLDLPWNHTCFRRDLTLPLEELRAQEGTAPWHGQDTATVTLPAMRAGGVRVAIATLYAMPFVDTDDLRNTGYRTPDEAHAQAWGQIAYLRELAAAGEITLIHTRADLEGVLAGTLPHPGLALNIEGAAPVRTPDDLPAFAEAGVRFVTLAWNRTRYAGSTSEPGPLTEDGVVLLRAMEELGLGLDVSHLDEGAAWQALERFGGQVVATHANCRAIIPGARQLADDMIRAISERDGVIGLALYNAFIRPGWTREQGKAAVTLADLLPHVDRIVALAGSGALGIGSDLDGGLGRESIPAEIDSVADLPRLVETLQAHGHDADVVGSGNWLRVLRRMLP